MSDRFGKYELLEQIGAGGMAEVFLAKSFGAEGLEKILVIKRILPDYTENRRFVDMFISEAKIAVDLNHPNVVQIYDFGRVDTTYFLAMEFVDGVDLGRLISHAVRRGQKFPIGDAIFVATEMAKGLHYAHERKDRFGEALDIVHRDISPQNILVSRDGSVKIVDFGIAKATSVTDVSPHVVKGKFSYMSPEQAAGKSVDRRSDVFSLGVVLFEMICGRPLFKHTTQDETLSLVKSAVVPDIKNLSPDIPEKLEQIMYRVLSKEPADRFETARDLQIELTRLLYSLEDIHDATTVASLVIEAEKALPESTAERSIATFANTLANRQRTNPGTTASAQAKGVTPVTRMVDEIEPAQEAVELQTRERKEVVIVAGELSGLLELRNKMGQDKWLHVLQEITRIIDGIAFRNSAVVHRVNESGFVLIFGIPVSSENDAELAVRVTLDLHEAVSGMNPSLESQIQMSAGIAVGNVVLEQEFDQTGRRFSWSFFGDDFELAERLARQALGKEVLVGGQLYRRVRREYTCEKVDHVRAEVGGQVQKVQAYLLGGLKTPQDKIAELRRSYRSFYGRDIYLKAIRETYREVMLDQRAKSHIVTGSEGVGKSTLVQEFLGGLDSRNVRVVRGVVPVYQRDIPFGSLAMFLGETFRLGDLGDLRKVMTTVDTRIAALFPEEDETEREFICQSLGSVFGMKDAGSMLEKLNPAERKDRVFMSLLKALSRFSEKKPIVMAIDDAHYIDTLSMEFIRFYFDNARTGALFMILTAQQGGAHEAFPAWKKLCESENIIVQTLDELTHSEAERLVREMLRFHRIEDETLVQDILHRSGRNPLYIKEVVEILRDRGMLRKDTGERRQLKVGDESPHWLPSNVEGLIRARIDRLPLQLKLVLQRVAFLWTPFSLSDVKLVIPNVNDDEIDELVELNLLKRADDEDAKKHDTYDPAQTPPEKRTYSFHNALTKEVSAAGVLPEEAATIHATLADHLASQNDSESENAVVHSLLARHYEGAGESEKAIAFYFEAADEALEKSGPAEALRLCDKVLSQTRESSTFHYRTMKIRTKALYALGLRHETEQALELLQVLAEKGSDENELADIYLLLARFWFDHTELKKARGYAEQAVEIANKNDDRSMAANATIQQAMISLSEGNREHALALASSVAEQLSSENDAKEAEGLVRALNLVGIVHRQTGRHREALEAYNHALEIATHHGLGTLRRFLLTNAGLALAYLGEFSEALAHYTQALDECKQLGHRREEANLLINIGHAHLLRGELEAAVLSTRRGIYLARKTSSNHQLADGLISMGAIYLEQGALGKAEDALHEGLRIADSIPNVYLGVHATLLIAQVNLSTGSTDSARIAFVQAEDAFERSEQADMSWGYGYAAMLMARAKKIAGDRDAAIKWSETAMEVVRSGEIFAKEEILYYHAQILPDVESNTEARCAAISLARAIVMERHDKIPEDAVRKVYLAKDLNRKILNVAKIICDGD